MPTNQPKDTSQKHHDWMPNLYGPVYNTCFVCLDFLGCELRGLKSRGWSIANDACNNDASYNTIIPQLMVPHGAT
eukprot:3548366-Amphidinium_carterae.1